METYNTEELKNYLNANLNQNNFQIFLKLLNSPHEQFKKIFNLLIQNIIVPNDLDSVVNWTEVGLEDFISNYEFDTITYVQDETATINGYNYLTQTLGMQTFLENAVSNDFETKKLDDYIYDVKIGELNDFNSYLNLNSFVDIFDANIFPKLLTNFSCTFSLEENFPVTEVEIRGLFSTLTSTFTHEGTTYSMEDLGYKIYDDIFSTYYNNTNYFTQENLIFLLFNIGKRMSKLEMSKSWSNGILNTNYPTDLVRNQINQTAMDIETYDAEPDNAWMNDLLYSIYDIPFNVDLIQSTNKTFTIINIVEHYYIYMSDLVSYNSEFSDMFDIIISKIEDFKELLEYNYFLANTYLL